MARLTGCKEWQHQTLALQVTSVRFLQKHITLFNPSTILKIGRLANRLAQGVRSKEEPEESFLKGVPAQPDRIEIIYPVLFSDGLCILYPAVAL